jgi:thymidylate synthase (FAD)
MTETRRTTVPAAEEILDRYFPVLDHGFVALVDYMGSDNEIARAARVSYGAGARKSGETRGLVRYLMRHKHTSPLEMVELKFHCSMPIFVARQWIRHRTANVNEVSGRYSVLPMLFYTPPDDQLRAQSKANKQGRAEEGTFGDQLKEMAHRQWDAQRKGVVEGYQWLLGHDFARELARIDLPLSTYTQWYWKIDLHNLLHFLTLRVDAHAQWEIQQFGKVIAGMLKCVAPRAYEAWIDYEVCGARLSRMELEILRSFVYRHENSLMGGNGDLSVSKLEMEKTHGLTARETDEFLEHFDSIGAPDKVVPDFELDLSQSRDAAFFEAEAAATVPREK